MATSRLYHDADMLKRAELDQWALQFARIEWYVFVNKFRKREDSKSVGFSRHRAGNCLEETSKIDRKLMFKSSPKPSHLSSHYFVHGGFMNSDEHILDNVDKIRHIPATIVQGRYDVVCPAKTAWELHKVHFAYRFDLFGD